MSLKTRIKELLSADKHSVLSNHNMCNYYTSVWITTNILDRIYLAKITFSTKADVKGSTNIYL